MAVTTAGPRSRAARRVPTRALAAAGIVLAVLLIPLLLPDFRASQVTKGVIYAIIGLSMNVLLGYLGQISLGHQAFVGVGAFVSGYMVTEAGLSFYMALVISALFGAVAALLLGVAALRVRGLYLALITLAYGFVAQESIFEIRALTGGGAGMLAPKPGAFRGDKGYLYLCMIVLALVLLMDWRLMKTKAGRAVIAIRHDEQVAATMGINVTFYKIFAFMLSGFLAGLAGSLFAHWAGQAVATDYLLDVALLWVFMTVVGGLGSRAGIVAGSMFFALLPFVLESLPVPLDIREALPRFVPLLGALLLIVTLTLYPGGIGQQLLPIRRWLAGGPFRTPGHGKKRKRVKVRPGAPPTEVEAAAATQTPVMTEGDTAEVPVPPALAEGDGEASAARPKIQPGGKKGLRRFLRPAKRGSSGGEG